MLIMICLKCLKKRCFFENKVHSNSFLIMHQNIAGALSKTDMLELMLADFNNFDDSPDVICLSETFLKSGHENSFKLSNYD